MAKIRIQETSDNIWNKLIVGLIVVPIIVGIMISFIQNGFEAKLDQRLVTKTDDPGLNAYRSSLKNLNSNEKEKSIVDNRGENEYDEDWDGSSEDYDSNYNYYMSTIHIMENNVNSNHDYSRAAFRSLANSLSIISNKYNLSTTKDIQGKCTGIKGQATEITKNWTASNHADSIQQAAVASVEVMKEIQMEKFPDLKNNIEELEKQAKNITTPSNIMEQKKEVETFFSEAAVVLQRMKVA